MIAITSDRMHLLDAYEPIQAVPPPHLEGVIERIKSCFSNLSIWFHNSCAGAVYRKYNHFRPLFWEVYTFVSSAANLRTFDRALTVVKDQAHDIWQKFTLLEKLVRIVKIMSVVSIPFAIYGIGWEVGEIITGADRLSASLRMLENLAWLGESAATFATGLHMLGMAVQTTAVLAFSLYVASTFFSLATIILSLRNLYQASNFLDEVEKRESLSKKWEYIKEASKNCPKSLFDVNRARLNYLIGEVDQKSEENGVLQRAITIFKQRIKTKGWSHRLTILSSVITCLGMAVLLFTPILPLAYGMLVLSATLGIIRFFYERKSIQEMDAQLLRLIK